MTQKGSSNDQLVRDTVSTRSGTSQDQDNLSLVPFESIAAGPTLRPLNPLALDELRQSMLRSGFRAIPPVIVQRQAPGTYVDLTQPGHPTLPDPQIYRCLVGNHRLHCIRELVNTGRMSRNTSIPCIVLPRGHAHNQVDDLFSRANQAVDPVQTKDMYIYIYIYLYIYICRTRQRVVCMTCVLVHIVYRCLTGLHNRLSLFLRYL